MRVVVIGAGIVGASVARGHTVCGWLDDRLYAVATHSGITLAPLLGDLVARDLHDRRIDGLEPSDLAGSAPR